MLVEHRACRLLGVIHSRAGVLQWKAQRGTAVIAHSHNLRVCVRQIASDIENRCAIGGAGRPHYIIALRGKSRKICPSILVATITSLIESQNVIFEFK